jgi:hypothetical protein
VEAAPLPSPTGWRTAWTMARAAPHLLREGIGMLLRLKRAGVPVLWSSQVETLTGDGRVQTACVDGRVFDVDVVALTWDFSRKPGSPELLGPITGSSTPGLAIWRPKPTMTAAHRCQASSRSVMAPHSVACAWQWPVVGWQDWPQRASLV